MEHFQGLNESERYNNDLLHEIRKHNQLLEQLISLIQPQKFEIPKTITPKRNQPNKNTRKKVQ